MIMVKKIGLVAFTFALMTSPIAKAMESELVTAKPKLTPEGQQYFDKKLVKFAVLNFKDKVTKYLDKGANPNVACSIYKAGDSVTCSVCHTKNYTCPRCFKKSKCKIGIYDGEMDNKAPLIIGCIYWGRLDVVRLLIEKGADVNAFNLDKKHFTLRASQWQKGLSALGYALNAGLINTCKLLIQHGAKINYQTEQGMTLLMEYASKGDTKKCELLIQLGADYTIKDPKGNTAMILAASNKHAQTRDYLFSLEAKNETSGEKDTALEQMLNSAEMEIFKDFNTKETPGK